GLVHNRQWFYFSQSARKKAMDSLAIVGLVDFANNLFSRLSGGQRQRVLIARALVSQPRILLFDEPTAHVDTVAEKNLMDLLKQISKELTVILVSHDLGFVSQYVDTVVCVNRMVQKHPTGTLTGTMIQELYRQSIEMVHHGLSETQERHHHE
ncbi:MAG TPA: ATP-binding cassette domain-containing protein, partial [Candidatus Hydrogenedens sp.]|nr:ATP-binding cassette domain-containing protein [Candidatus Hydrogenedens sp.]